MYSEAVFEHLSSPTAAAREMFRVMKPGTKHGSARPSYTLITAIPTTSRTLR